MGESRKRNYFLGGFLLAALAVFLVVFLVPSSRTGPGGGERQPSLPASGEKNSLPPVEKGKPGGAASNRRRVQAPNNSLPSSFLVEVRDQGGRPVPGIGVAVLDPERGRELAGGETYKGGSVQFPLDLFDQVHGGTLQVGILLPLPKLPARTVTRTEAARGPILFTLPPLGVMEVRILEYNGAPFRGKGRISAHPVREEPVPRDFLRFSRMAVASTRFQGSHARLTGLGLGLRYRVYVSIPYREGGTVSKEVDGPTLDRNPVRLEVVLPNPEPDRAYLVMKLLEGGKPLPNTKIVCRFFQASSPPILKTGEKGILKIPIRLKKWTPRGHLRFFDLSKMKKRKSKFPPKRILFEVPPSLQKGVNDMGAFDLKKAPVVVGGKLLDSLGSPMRGRIVALYLENVPGEKPLPLAMTRSPWTFTYSNGTGRFRFLGYLRWRSFMVRSGFSGKDLAVARNVPLGTKNLVLEFAPPRQRRRISCKLNLDPDFPAPFVFLVRFEGKGENQGLTRVVRAQGFKNQLEPVLLETGPWEVEVLLGTAPFEKVGEIFVPPGKGPYKEPVLNPIDLRGLLKWARVKIQCRKEDLRRVEVRLNGKPYGTEFTLDRRRKILYVFARDFPCKLEVRIPGAGKKSIPRLSGDAELSFSGRGR